MPRAKAGHLSDKAARALLDELAVIWRALSENRPEQGDVKRGITLVRLCAGLTLNQWRKLSREHDLSPWLALPFGENPAPRLLELQKTIEDLTYKSEHDHLTGLANRAAFERTLDQELERTSRSGAPVTLAIIDLDDFKKVNDTHGHPCGDEVLTATAGILLSGKRSYDTAARIGGEEFALILPGAGLARAKIILERLLATLAARQFRCEEPETGCFAMTASAGIACHRGGHEMTAKALTALADQALYEAKASGKNCVKKAGMPSLPEAIRKTIVHADEKKFLFTGGRR